MAGGCATDASDVDPDPIDEGDDMDDNDGDDGDGDVQPDPVAWMRVGGNGDSAVGKLSADGGRLVFTSQATNLVDGDLNQAADAFVLSRLSMGVQRVSVSSSGDEAIGPKKAHDAAAWVTEPTISADGSAVSFVSGADNLVQHDTNYAADLFVHRLETGETTRANVGTDGSEADWDRPAGALSGDGRYVSFFSHASSLVADSGCVGVYLRDRTMGTTSMTSLTWQGNPDTGCASGGDGEATISSDGSTLAFSFQGGDIVEELETNDLQIYVRDRIGGGSELISMGADGAAGAGDSAAPQLTDDGALVAFQSDAANLFDGDVNRDSDVFVRDRINGVTELVSIAADGGAANGPSSSLSITADGRYVVFVSAASNLVAGDDNGVADVFVRDRIAGVTKVVTAPMTGDDADGESFTAVISGNGRVIAFSSAASNFITGDDNDAVDIFIAPNPFVE
jgi:Tol biopolymer transport system component